MTAPHPETRGKQMSKPDGGTVGKALEVLDQIASHGRPVRFSKLLESSDYPKATLFRLVQTLTQQNMLEYDDTSQTYTPGLRLVRLAHSAWAQSSLATIARPYVDDLAGTVGETVHLAQLDNGQVLFVDKRRSTQLFDTLAQAGQVAPAYCTGVGKAILAFMTHDTRQHALQQQAFLKYTVATHAEQNSLRAELEDIRVNGVAFDREEHQDGIISIAAPILANNTRVIGAVSIATSTARHTLDGLEQFRPRLLATASQIGEVAATWQFPDISQTATHSLGGEA